MSSLEVEIRDLRTFLGGILEFCLFKSLDTSTDDPFWFNSTEQPKWWSSYGECPLLDIETQTNRVRLVFEIIQLVGAFLYIAAALREMRFLGYNMFIENLVK